MADYLIKRNPDFTKFGLIEKRNNKNKGYSESIITSTKRNPLPANFNEGDILWIAESNWGIYASGKVIKINKLELFNSVDELIKYIHIEKKQDSSFWMDKIIRFSNKLIENNNSVFKYQEYFIDQKLLNISIPLVGNLGRLSKPGFAASFIELNESESEFLKNPYFQKLDFKLSPNIPSSLKLDIYSFFNTQLAIQHFIDIDHFVPKSAGGPGNLIENLVPIGLSLNRYKSNSIPKGFFIESSKYNDLKPLLKNDYLTNNDDYISSREAVDNALKINLEIKKWDNLDEIRFFYKSVLGYHFPEYITILDDYRKMRGY